jgi:hypothetical protein
VTAPRVKTDGEKDTAAVPPWLAIDPLKVPVRVFEEPPGGGGSVCRICKENVAPANETGVMFPAVHPSGDWLQAWISPKLVVWAGGKGPSVVPVLL